jgi:NSS family neurotransmitter:Na+ symporter
LILTYACYARKREDVALNGALTAVANNSVSLLAGITIFSTVFALGAADGVQELISGRGSTNTGLAFIFLPELFGRLPGGIVTQSFFATIFFLGLFFAAVTSLISMLELGVRVFVDMGFRRKPTIVGFFIVGFILGIPSALSLQFFDNQDFVWGIALMISGAFICFGLIRYNVGKFRSEAINHPGSDVTVGKWFDHFISWLIPAEAILLILWWFYLAITSFDREGWWNPLNTYSVATCVAQWGIVFIILIALNRWITRRTLRRAV